MNWPISYDDLKPYYEMAEREIGVAGDVKEHKYPGIGEDFWGKDYVFPMHEIPPSYLDKKFAEGVDDMNVRIGQRDFKMRITSTPQGRNAAPNNRYKLAAPIWDPYEQKLLLEKSEQSSYQPVGATWDHTRASDAKATRVVSRSARSRPSTTRSKLSGSKEKERNVEVITQAVASAIEIDPASGRVTGITSKDAIRSPTTPSIRSKPRAEPYSSSRPTR